jgi:DNA-binding NarL/FixJ family response regulator
MGERIRVLMANEPPLSRHLLGAAIGDQADMEVVGEVGEEEEIVNAVERTSPDFLIISLGPRNERPPICDEVLRKRPDLRVVAVAPDRDAVMYYWVSPEIRASRIEPSEAGMLCALRGKADFAGR